MEIPGILAVVLLAASGARASCPVVSEIAAAPSAGNTEWIEVAEVSGEGIDLGGWTLGDGSVRRTIEAPAPLAAGGFLVVAADCAKLWAQFGTSSIPCARTAGWNQLSKEADRVVLRDAGDGLCDSVAWERASWGDWPAGRSLERIGLERTGNDPTNWVATSHPLGGTPGWRGESALEPIGAASSVEVVSRRVRPGKDPARMRLHAAWDLRVKAEVYDLSRRKLATLLDGQIPASGELEWDGVAAGRLVPPGAYGIVVEFGPADRVPGRRLFREWVVVGK